MVLGAERATLDKQIKELKDCKPLTEAEVEALCLQSLGRIAYLAGRLGDSMGYLQGAAQQFEHSGLVFDGLTFLTSIVEFPKINLMIALD